jgi:hypothetical protein
VQQLEAKITGFEQQKDPLRAALAAKEMEMTLGGAVVQSSPVAKMALASADAPTAALLDAVTALPHNTADFLKNMQLFSQVGQQAPDYIYLVELFRADQIRAILESRTNRSADEDNAMRSALEKLSAAIIANPWLTGAYYDLGDAYFKTAQPRTAWVMWSQARRLNPQYPALQNVMSLETQVEKDFPEYF